MRRIYRGMKVTVMLLLLACLLAHAQRRAVTGTVKDETGLTIPGASIVVKGGNSGASTDANGAFSLEVSETDFLTVSFIGYKTVEVLVGTQTQLNVVLESDLTTLGEVVVVGYGEQKRTSLTSAIGTMDAEKVVAKPVVNLSNNLQGRIAGVMTRQGSGEPGQDGAGINIRGIGTYGNSSPLLVVDGIYRDFSNLDPNSVESFTVLKDAAAVAPYGLAGANGVILVTTKKGKSGAPTLSYNTWVGIQNPTRLTNQVNSYEYALMKNEIAANDGTAPTYTSSQVAGYKKTVDGAPDADPDKYPNSSPLRDILARNQTVQYHNIELSGGSEKVKYYTGFGYTKQNGMYKTVKQNKYNFIAKIDADATKTTRVSVNINGIVTDQDYPTHSASDIFYQAFRTPPTSAVYYSNGDWGQYVGRSLVGQTFHSGTNHLQSTQLYTTLSVEQKIPFIDGLSIKGVASFDPRFGHNKQFETPVPVYNVDTAVTPHIYNLGYQGVSKPILTESYTMNRAFTYQAYLNYAHTFGNHAVSVLGVFESRNVKYNTLTAGKRNYNTTIPELDAGSATPADLFNSGTSSDQKQAGYIYRVSYNYKEKYMAEVAGRYDGHYAFAPSNRWGFFPSYSLGWRISEENFAKNISWLDQAKVRASYGQSGNLPYSGGSVYAFQYLTFYNLNSGSAVFNGAPTQSVSEALQPNPGITWEKANKFNVGLEASIFNGLLSFEADYFSEKRNNMLVTPSTTVSQEYGVGLAQINGGIMHNAGYEVSATSRFNVGDLSISLTGNFMYAKNKVIQIFENATTKDNPNRSQTGRPLGTFFGYHALGLFQVEDDKNGDGVIDGADGYNVTQFGALHPGDIKYADIAGAPGADGKPTGPDGKIDQNDFTAIGNPMNAQIQFGFIPSLRFKGFDLELVFAGAAQSSIRLSGSLIQPFDESASANKLQFKDHWTPTNRNATYTRLSISDRTNNAQYSDWWMRNNSFVRLKSMELGYSLPHSLTQTIKIQNVRFFISGQNVLTWTPKMKEIVDPEASTWGDGGVNGQYYAQQRVISVGARVTF